MKGSYTGRALTLIRQKFPEQAWRQTEAVLITCNACKVLLTETFTQIALRELDAKMKALQARDPVAVQGWDVNSYMSSGKSAIVFHTFWLFSPEIEKRTLSGVRELVRVVTELDRRGRGLGFRVTISGQLSISTVLVQVLGHEVFLKELMVTPLAILVLVLQVRSVRLAALCGLTMLASQILALGLLVLAAQVFAVTPICPVIVVVLGLALSVDYSLFIFARFREEVQAERLPAEALDIAMGSSGSVIALSGSVLGFSFLFGALLPGSVVTSMAMTGMLVTSAVLSAHLTLTPCMLSLFPSFFAYGLTPDVSRGGARDPRGSKAWFRWATWITFGKRPIWGMVVAYGFMAPAIWQLGGYRPITDLQPEIPRGSIAAAGYQVTKARMPAGELYPVFLVETSGQGDMRSDAAFARACQRLRGLVDSTKGTHYELLPADFISPFAMPRQVIEVFQQIPGLHTKCPSLMCLKWSSSPPDCPMLPSAKEMLEGRSVASSLGLDEAYQTMWKRLVSKDNRTALTKIETRFGQDGAMLKPFFKALAHSHGDGLAGFSLAIEEISEACYHRLPLVLGLLWLLQCVFIGASFGALLVPFKLLLTVICPVAFVYGIVVCVFQHGVLAWTGLRAFEASGISWLIPIGTVCVLLGLSVDYDIFLFARVMELREAGYDNRAAVVGGMATAGSPITSAGIIMAIAFSGMLLSSISFNNQLGFVMSFGVLVDIFLVRGALMPCVLMLGDFVNYWPRKMPEPVRSLEELEDYLDQRQGPCKAIDCS